MIINYINYLGSHIILTLIINQVIKLGVFKRSNHRKIRANLKKTLNLPKK